jgi:DNA-binding NtrC family response regulator
MKKITGIGKILIVDSDTDYICRLSKILDCFDYKGNKFKVLSSTNEEETQMKLKGNPDIKLVLIDDSMECIEHVLNLVEKHPVMQILIISEQARNTSKQDQEFVHKSDIDKIKDCIVTQLNDYNKIKKDSKIPKNSSRRDIEYLMGKGKVISKVIDQVEKYAKINKPILIEGATGTGKELIVGYLCRLCGREITVVNCGAVSKELAYSELFGSVKGAFTDARNMKGKVEAAEGGVLFLDEFNSLPLDIQVNFLRLIENNTYTKLGDTIEYKANVRIIAASNKPVEELVEKGELRQDLRERFVKVIHIPTLNERIEDMDYFIDRFIAEENKTLNRAASISNDARKLLAGHDWLGNIRQLKNCIESLVIEVELDSHSQEYIIKTQLLRGCFDGYRQEKTGDSTRDDGTEEDYTIRTACETVYDNAAEKAIRRALIKTGGNNDKAIKLLEISRGTYYNFKKKFGIE